jgi:hypothetical protein
MRRWTVALGGDAGEKRGVNEVNEVNEVGLHGWYDWWGAATDVYCLTTTARRATLGRFCDTKLFL